MELNTTELIHRRMEKQAAKKERKMERDEAGIVNKLKLERTEYGTYYVRYTLGGNPPDMLKGTFTHKQKLKDAVQQYYGTLDLLVE